MVYKCLTSETYYTNVLHFEDRRYGIYNSPVVTRVCEGDPRIYQACSLTFHTKILNSETICDNLICPDLGSNQLVTVVMTTFDYCESYHKFKLMCRPTAEETYCSNFKSQLVGSVSTKECDGSCQHDTNCEDEALCNGFRYGKFCSRGGNKHFIKATMICNESSDCDDLSDEQQCSSRSNSQFVCSGRTGKTIFNYTRCAPIEINLSVNTVDDLSKYTSYCLEFEDQYNCSDPLRGVLICTARGYPSTISSGVLCLDITPLCDNGLDQDCTRTSPLCLLHKHLLCDGISDCEDKSDEQYSECENPSYIKCYRW